MNLETVKPVSRDSQYNKQELFDNSRLKRDFVDQLRSTQNTSLQNMSISNSELVLFTTQLSIMLDSGVVLTDAIEAISVQMRPSTFKDILNDISLRINNGDCFSAALLCYPKAFDSMFISMVKASEESGKMATMLDVLSGYLNAQEQTRKQVKSAMIYPFIMLLMAVAATGSLMFFVLPKFTRIYEARGAALPKLTSILVNFSKLLGDITFMATAVTVITIIYFMFISWKKTKTGRKACDWVKVHSPIFGTMFVDAVLTKSMRIMATMVNTGVSILDAINVIKISCDNYFFQEMWMSVDKKIRDGYQLSDAIITSPHGSMVAPGIIQMLRAGEKSGQIGKVCDKISIFYEKKLQNTIRAATSLIEPVMIIFMGCVIGTIAIALLLPVFKISSVIAH